MTLFFHWYKGAPARSNFQLSSLNLTTFFRHITLLPLLALAFSAMTQTLDSEPVPYYYERNTAKEREAQPMPYVREADVAWEELVWRTIDFREKFNHFFYYPRERQGFMGRLNFAYMLWNAVLNDEIPIYEDDEFKIRIDNQDFIDRMTKADTITLEIVDDDENYEYRTVLIPNEFNGEEVFQIRLKESWYIDKAVTEQNVRIIGICLTKEFYKEHDGDIDYMGTVPLFWIPMLSPQVQRLMARNEATWQQNIAHQPSWELVFINRMFNSFITKVSNVYNRTVLDYLTGQDAIWEAERLENELLDMSQDMWEY